MTKRAVIWLARKVEKPVLRLVEEDYNENGVGELLTSRGPAYQVNIRVFNQLQHSISGWPGGKPDADDTHRPERALPFPKRALVLSPEPHDAFMGMGGTIERLVDQGHEVRLAVQTSGNLRVRDVEAHKFASVVREMAEVIGRDRWEGQEAYAASILKQLEEKGEFGTDPETVRRLKGLILRGDARDAARICGVPPEAVEFLDLPFYEQGRYRRFQISPEDIERMADLVSSFRPHQIYVTGDVADPSSLDALCFMVFREAMKKLEKSDWINDCRIWLYRSKGIAMETSEIEMAVPMSPDQLALKAESIRKFQSIGPKEIDSPEKNRQMAREYDALGMAEYEAIEAFRGWPNRAGLPPASA